VNLVWRSKLASVRNTPTTSRRNVARTPKAAPKPRRFPAIILLPIGCLPPGKLLLIRPPEIRGPPHPAARGIDVTPPQVSQVLKKMGVAQRIRRKRMADQPVASAANHKPATSDSFTLHELLAAKQFAKMIGDPARAKNLLEALDRLS